MSEISPQDIEMLTRELNLKETTPTTLDALVATFGREELVQRLPRDDRRDDRER